MGNLRGARALRLVLALSCGSPQKGGGGKTGGDGTSTRTYQPFGIKDDAKAANQAVILGTDDKNGSTVLQLPALPSKGLVDAMFVKLGISTASGGSTPVKLSTAPNSDGSVQVGIYEEMSGGTGAQWRAGVWVYAFVAANFLNKDLTDFTFAASSGGFIDGASASGLMAGIVTAAKKSAYATVLATREITSEFVNTLETHVAAAAAKSRNAANCTVAKMTATANEGAAERVLLRSLRMIQAAARQKFLPAQPERLADYYIGQRINENRAMLESFSQNIIAKAAEDALPGITSAFLPSVTTQRADYIASYTAQVTELARG